MPGKAKDTKQFKLDAQTRQEVIEAGGRSAMREINERIRRILDQAPSDATADLEVKKGKRGYQGLLKIFSTQRRFVGGFRGDRFIEVIDKVFCEVQDQIAQWKKERQSEISETSR